MREVTSLYQQFDKPIWVTEIASGSSSSAAANLALMEDFVPWANSQPWIERYFWNQAVSDHTHERSLRAIGLSAAKKPYFRNAHCGARDLLSKSCWLLALMS